MWEAVHTSWRLPVLQDEAQVKTTRQERSNLLKEYTNQIVSTLNERGDSVQAVITVVLFEEDDMFHVASAIKNQEEAGKIVSTTMDVLDEYMHERGICPECDSKPKTSKPETKH